MTPLDSEKTFMGIRFEPTLNFGHVLTFIGFIITGFVAYQTLDKRVLVLETSILKQEIIDSNQDRDRNRISGDTKETLIEIKRAIERLDTKVDRLSNG